MQTTKLNIQDKLPLTCSRRGNCCHGNLVMLNPWELASLANEKKQTPRKFRDMYTDVGGIRLRFDGKPGWKNKKACSQYITDRGCSVHVGRPLACRLFPLGRQLQNQTISYMYQGDVFPCMEGCSEVTDLPLLSVEKYLQGQQTAAYETAQNQYLNLMQHLADIAFELLLDTPLIASSETKTLELWRIMGNEQPEALTKRIGTEWMDSLIIPSIDFNAENPIPFVQQHTELLQLKVQQEFGTSETIPELHEACGLIMGLALLLARGLGVHPEVLVEHWINTAKSHGAVEM